MSLALALLLAQAAPGPGPIDWNRLAPLPWRETPQVTPDLARFVVDEVRARRCTPPRRARALALDVAVLVRADSTVRVTVPRAINCPTVEQFAAGLVSSFARNNLQPAAEGWYRANVSFSLGR